MRTYFAFALRFLSALIYLAIVTTALASCLIGLANDNWAQAVFFLVAFGLLTR